MLQGLSLIDFVAKLARKPKENLKMEDFVKIDKKLESSKVKWWISSAHTGGRRRMRLRGIDSEPCSQSMFPCDDADGNATQMSVADYFGTKYPDHPLKRPADWPCVCVGPANDPRKTRVPIELCSIVTGQPAPVTPDIQAEMIKETADPPESRFKFIQLVHRDMLEDAAANETPSAFEIGFGDQLIDADGTILRSPVLQCRPSGRSHDAQKLQDVLVNSQKGEWNLRNGSNDLGFLQPGRIAGFAVVKFERSADDHGVRAFIDKLQQMARERGMDLGRQEGGIIDLSSHHYGDAVEQALDRAIRSLGRPVGLVICFIGDKSAMNAKEVYPAIKRWSHVKASIPTQCVQTFKATKKLATSPQYTSHPPPLFPSPSSPPPPLLPPPSSSSFPNPYPSFLYRYHAGVLLKINLKLGGSNFICKTSEGLGLLRSAPTMVVGFDVNHPQPGSTKPSYAALVASLDVECTQFHTVIGAQKSRTEIELVGFVDKMRDCLRAFQKKNGTPPQRILFYRDGVAHNQFDEVKRTEIGRIFEACTLEGGKDYIPQLTFIVVQQRTAARFAQAQSHRQLTAGTVINSGVVGSDGCAQPGSRPVNTRAMRSGPCCTWFNHKPL